MESKNVDFVVFLICMFFLIAVFSLVLFNINSIPNDRTPAEPGRAIVEADIYNKKSMAVLNGKWEYYDGIHLVSSPVPKPEVSNYAVLPMRWCMFSRSTWGNNGWASYRIVLNNLPVENCVFCLIGYAPNINLYIDGVLYEGQSRSNQVLAAAEIAEKKECEIIIEVTSSWLTGIYACPWLFSSNAFQKNTALATGIWQFSIGCFFTAFIVCAVLLSKLKNKRHFHLFVRSFICIAIFYISENLEMAGHLHFISRYISFEQSHLTIIAFSVFFCINAQLLLISVYPNVFNKTIMYVLAGFFYFSTLLKLIVDAYINIDSLIFTFLFFLLAYEIICTFSNMNKYQGLGAMAAGTILHELSFCIVSINQGKHYFLSQYIILPTCLMLVVLCYVYYWATRFALIEESAINENITKQHMIDAEIAYLTSQVQPHFQYNTLTMIQELCYTAPEKAAEAIVLYSRFLRNRIDFNKYARLVPFQYELDSINDYVQLQKMRFRDTITFQFDIAFDDFFVPPLSIQTLMENAVHHGLRKKKEGGVLTLSTALEDSKTVVIKVCDNGVGFDTDNSCSDYRGSGLTNCRYRVETLLGGSVAINSSIGEGTIVTVTIPRTSDSSAIKVEEETTAVIETMKGEN